MKIVATFTEEQYRTIMDVMEKEWDAELKYQEESDVPDCTLLENYLKSIEVLQYMNVRNIVEEVLAEELIEIKRKQLEALKERGKIE